MPSPEQPQHIPGADHNGVGNGMGMEKGGVFFADHRKFTGIEVVRFQPVGDVTDGIKMAGIKIKAQSAQNRHCKLGTGKGLADTNLDVQRCQQSGQVIVQVTVCLVTHGVQHFLQDIPLAGGQGQSVYPGVCGNALVAVAAGICTPTGKTQIGCPCGALGYND